MAVFLIYIRCQNSATNPSTLKSVCSVQTVLIIQSWIISRSLNSDAILVLINNFEIGIFSYSFFFSPSGKLSV